MTHKAHSGNQDDKPTCDSGEEAHIAIREAFDDLELDYRIADGEQHQTAAKPGQERTDICEVVAYPYTLAATSTARGVLVTQVGSSDGIQSRNRLSRCLRF